MTTPLYVRSLAGTPDARELRVGMAQLAVGTGDEVLATIGLGSCVAIALWDEAAGVAGLAHVLLPDPAMSHPRRCGDGARFATTAVPALLDAMARRGARGPSGARLVGGATMFGALLATSGVNVGRRNVEAARGALADAGIALLAEEVGGEHGRSVYLHARTGRLRVRSLLRGDRDI